MRGAGAVTVSGLMLAGMFLILWGLPGLIAACVAIAAVVGFETRQRLPGWLEERRRKRGWTEEDEPVLRGEKSLL